MSNRLSIVFYVNGMPFQGDTLEHASLGGSETAGLYMAREMAARGHDVVVFSNTDKPGKYDGVNYLHIDGFFNYMLFTPTDVLIAQRVPQIFAARMKSKVNILWAHDLALKRGASTFRGALWNVDEIWGVSKFHVEQMREIYGAGNYWATRNGIEPIVIDASLTRAPKRLIYTSRPERGMDILLRDIMPRLWEQDPAIELRLAGYDNTVAEMKPFYDMLFSLIAKYKSEGRNVEWLGALTKKQLYAEYQQATLYAYPSNFEEVSCITAMECMGNGLPFIGSKLAALPETLAAGAGTLIEGDATSEAYQTAFCNAVLNAIASPELRYSAKTVGTEAASKLSWADLAAEWERHLYAMFEARTANKDTLASHFYRMEDIMALKALDLPIWNDKLAREYPLLTDSKAYAALYEDYGANFRAKIEAGEFSAGINEYTRVKVAISAMGEPKRVLDYGCAIGNEAIQFVNAFGCEVIAVNISADEMAVGQTLADKHCKAPEKITWIKAATPEALAGTFDVVYAGEILEHVQNPTQLINQLEAKCVEGGRMIFTVPLGPWGDVDEICEQRGHLWNFEKVDLKDLFDGKKELRSRVVSGMVNPKNRETLGWYVIDYIKDSACPTGTIDMARKCGIQAPRQTVSACMIIGGAQEGHLHKCLDSILRVADELIIADTGMSFKTQEILKHYPQVVRVTAPNPLTAGFDVARNVSLAYATKDWVLWLDSDEELLRPENMFKYLRANCYAGYSIRQHHFSAEPPNAFPPDLPVRLFRNGLGVKFFGVVHEHPEKELNAGVGNSTVLSDVEIAHAGYYVEEIRRNRFLRNYPLMLKDREKYPDRLLGKFLMMRDQVHLARYKAEQAKQLTPEIVELCEAAIKTYRDDFMGKPSMMSNDGLMFYSEALAILGRGKEYAFSFAIKDGVDSDTVARFANSEDFLNHVTAKIKEQAQQYEGRYV